MRMKTLVLGCLLGSWVVPSIALAQSTGATIMGIVVDETKAALAGVTVTIRQVETDARRVVVTDGRGRYQAPALEPGSVQT